MVPLSGNKVIHRSVGNNKAVHRLLIHVRETVGSNSETRSREIYFIFIEPVPVEVPCLERVRHTFRNNTRVRQSADERSFLKVTSYSRKEFRLFRLASPLLSSLASDIFRVDDRYRLLRTWDLARRKLRDIRPRLRETFLDRFSRLFPRRNVAKKRDSLLSEEIFRRSLTSGDIERSREALARIAKLSRASVIHRGKMPGTRTRCRRSEMHERASRETVPPLIRLAYCMDRAKRGDARFHC